MRRLKPGSVMVPGFFIFSKNIMRHEKAKDKT